LRSEWLAVSLHANALLPEPSILRLSAAPPALQVGLIASLKNEHKHEIVTQVGPLRERRLPGAGGGGGWGGCASLHPPTALCSH
jgi:hypothetical protein